MILVALFLFPSFTFLYCLFKRMNTWQFYVSFFAVILFYCLNIYLIESDIHSGDITRYIDYVSSYKDMPWKYIFLEKDFFYPLTGKILANITTNMTVYILFYGAIFALFSFLSIKLVARNFVYDRYPKAQYLFLFALTMAFYCGYINSLRFAIASVFYLWCLLEIILNDKKIFFLLILLAPTIHFSFWAFVPVPFLYLLLKKKLLIAQIIFLISFAFLNQQTSTFISNHVDFLNEGAANSIEMYSSEEGYETMSERHAISAEEGNLNRMISRSIRDVRNYGVMFGVFLISLLGYRTIKSNPLLLKTFTLILISSAMANIAASTLEGARFYHVMCAIAIYTLFAALYLSRNSDNQNAVMILTSKYKVFIYIVFALVAIWGLSSLYSGRYGYNMPNFLFGNILFNLI